MEKKLTTKEVLEGDTVIQEGEEADTLFIVVEGQLKVTKLLSFNQQNTEICEFRDGDFFGELSFLDGEKRSATVTALKDSTVAYINANQLKSLNQDKETIRLFAKLITNIAVHLAKRLRDTNHLMIKALYSEYRQAIARVSERDNQGWLT